MGLPWPKERVRCLDVLTQTQDEQRLTSLAFCTR